MRILILLLVITAGAGGVVAALLAEDPGYVMINIAGYTLESTVAALTALLVFSLAALVLGWRLLRGSWRMPGRIAHFVRERRSEKAQLQFRGGLLKLAAGHWQKAEIELLRRAADQPDPVANYLYAAEAAQRLQAPERRDRYLELARKNSPDDDAAVIMQRARLLAEADQPADALVALDELNARLPRHAPAMKLRLDLLERMHNWNALRALLPDASGLVDEKRLEELAELAWSHGLRDAGHGGELEALRSMWNKVPKPLRKSPGILATYTDLLHAAKADAEGLRLIRAQLKQAYDPRLIEAYGRLEGGDGVAQLASVEEWLKKYGEQPELLLVAGRLCLRNQLWGRARSYFEAGLNLAPDPQFQLELGRLAEQNDDAEAARAHYLRGLEMATSQPPA